MALICKAKFNSNLLHTDMPAVDSFFDQFSAILVDVVAIADAEIPLKIIAEVVCRDIKMGSNIFYLFRRKV